MWRSEMKNNVHHARAEQNTMKVLQLLAPISAFWAKVGMDGGVVAGEGGTGKCFNIIANQWAVFINISMVNMYKIISYVYACGISYWWC